MELRFLKQHHYQKQLTMQDTLRNSYKATPFGSPVSPADGFSQKNLMLYSILG
jgi:hypothetical protein